MLLSRHLLALVCALAAAGLFGACQQPSTTDVDQTEEGVVRLGSVEAVDTLTRGVTPNARPLVFDGFRGRVDLTGENQEGAELRFVKRGRGDDAETARGVLNDVSVQESGTQETYTYTLNATGEAYAAVDVSGTVPQGTELRLEGSTGPVSVAGVRGPITVRHDHGPVTLRGTGDSVDVEIENGDVEVHAAEVPLDAEVHLRTTNGDVTLRLPPASSAQISARTSVGVVRTQGLPLSEQRFNPRNAGGRYDAQLGAGGATVDLQTENGDVLIAAPDTTAPDRESEDAPERDSLQVPASDTTVTPRATPDTTTPAPSDTGQIDTTNADSAVGESVQ